MGSSKKVTVSYWYKLIAHLGWCKGPIDALLEMRGGDRVAWKGRQTTSGIVNVNKPDLYGGESAEGGIDGQFEVMMGDAGQMPNAYLADEFGDAQPGYRGRSTIVLRGPKIGAGNPYPKTLYFKLERIYKGWDDDQCWYPEKAGVPIPTSGPAAEAVLFEELNMAGDVYLSPTWGPDAYIEVGGFALTDEIVLKVVDGEYVAWSRWAEDWFNSGRSWTCGVSVSKDDGSIESYLDSLSYPPTYYFPTAAQAHAWAVQQPEGVFTGSTTYKIHFNDYAVNQNRGGLSLRVVRRSRFFLAMNPAHILYDSITSRRENGGMEEPAARINEASFRAAADRLYEEGFGLCCTWFGGESAEQFQQRICNVAGASLSQSRMDGQYYIDLLREPTGPLPTITDDDILEWEAEPAIPPESINQVQVKWFDPETRQERITTPVQSLGAIEDAGGVIADTREYYEIPAEHLALRVAQRDLQSVASALWKFTLSCTRKPFDLRPGMQVRLLCPKRGFADVVVVIGEIDYGDFSNSEVNIIAVQDVFSMPSGSFVDPQEGLGPPTSQDPVNIANATAMETPYVELAAALTTAELNALQEDVGYLMVGARRPANGNNYLLATKAAGEDYETYGNNDWTPSARIVEGDSLPNAEPQTVFTFVQQQLLDRVEVGTWAWWGSEMCRVDSLDRETGQITLGRACADTVPQEHEPLDMIYFIGDWYGTDSREYADGEIVSAKLMNRTGQGQIDLSSAPEVTTEMDSRQARPYPPAKVRVNGQPFPGALTGEITVTWAHRDRLLQADQLIDGEQESVGPEPGTTYNVRWFIGDVLMHQETGIAGAAASYSPAAGGIMRIELESERDGLTSWQMQVREFPVGSPLQAEDETVITAENGDAIIMG